MEAIARGQPVSVDDYNGVVPPLGRASKELGGTQRDRFPMQFVEGRNSASECAVGDDPDVDRTRGWDGAESSPRLRLVPPTCTLGAKSHLTEPKGLGPPIVPGSEPEGILAAKAPDLRRPSRRISRVPAGPKASQTIKRADTQANRWATYVSSLTLRSFSSASAFHLSWVASSDRSTSVSVCWAAGSPLSCP
jgi:hypothetical protein